MALLKHNKLPAVQHHDKTVMNGLQRLIEASLIFVVLGNVYLLLALLSFSPFDPGWSQTSWDGPVQNIGGAFGAWLADVCFFTFGFFAYFIPVNLVYVVWRLFCHVRAWREINFFILSLQLLGFVLVTLGLTGLGALSHAEIYVFPAGGVIGQILESMAFPVLQRIGSILLFLLAFAVGVTLLTGYSWLTIAERLGAFIRAFVYKVRAIEAPALPKQIAKKTQIQQTQAPLEPVADTVIRHEPIMTVATPPEAVIVDDEPVIILEAQKTQPVAPVQSTEKPVKTKPALPSEAVELPSISLLDLPCEQGQTLNEDEVDRLAHLVETKLAEYNVRVKVVDVSVGPVITCFELELSPGMKASKITNLSRDLARSLSAMSVRVVEVIPSKPYVGLEIPNPYRQTVYLRSIFASEAFSKTQDPMSLVLGVDISGRSVVVNLAKMPHLLVAGTTGSGKSVGVNVMILSLLYKATPEQVRFIMIDPKMLELSIYEGIPHLLTEVVTDMKDAANALRWCVAEMERRYKLMSAVGVRNLKGFNAKVKAALDAGTPLSDPLWEPQQGRADAAPELHTLPSIVVVVDEFADMMMIVGKKVEELIARIAQKARAAGIHLILATQRPSVDVITGLIKANIPTRVSFQVSSKIDSRTILDQQGAESLLGMGDMLYLPAGESIPLRVHGAFVDDHEVHRVVEELKKQPAVPYEQGIISGDNDTGSFTSSQDSPEDLDPLFDEAVEFVVTSRRGSTSSIQRKFKIGYNRAARIIEQMESQGIVSALGTNGLRDVLAPPPAREHE